MNKLFTFAKYLTAAYVVVTISNIQKEQKRMSSQMDRVESKLDEAATKEQALIDYIKTQIAGGLTPDEAGKLIADIDAKLEVRTEGVVPQSGNSSGQTPAGS